MNYSARDSVDVAPRSSGEVYIPECTARLGIPGRLVVGIRVNFMIRQRAVVLLLGTFCLFDIC